MPEEVKTQPVVPADPKQDSEAVDPIKALSDMMAGLKADIDALKAAPPVTKPEPPAPAPAPEPPVKEVKESPAAYQRRLEIYAAEQAQAAMRYRLSAKYGVPVEQLEGEYTSPEAMEQHASLLATQARLDLMAKQLEDKIGATPEQGVIPVDTGGLSGQPVTKEELEQRYADIKAMGPSSKAQMLLLDTIYHDPSKLVRGG